MTSSPDPTPLVSVRLICYNQRDVVAQAVESALGQRTDFPYEVVIGDDCSTDGTAEIVRGYAAHFPAKVRLLARDRRLGRQANFLDTLGRCRGDLVALLDGDDYWTSPLKLQRQVDLLGADPAAAGCFHTVLQRREGGSGEAVEFRPRGEKRRYGLADCLGTSLLQSGSLLFRRGAAGESLGWLEGLAIVDWGLTAELASRGDLLWLDRVMSVYRLHAGGVWAGMGAAGQSLAALQTLLAVNARFGGRHAAVIRPRLRGLCGCLGRALADAEPAGGRGGVGGPGAIPALERLVASGELAVELGRHVLGALLVRRAELLRGEGEHGRALGCLARAVLAAPARLGRGDTWALAARCVRGRLGQSRRSSRPGAPQGAAAGPLDRPRWRDEAAPAGRSRAQPEEDALTCR